MYELVDRYLRRLDSELFKFKIELEADNAGITEILEKSKLRLKVFFIFYFQVHEYQLFQVSFGFLICMKSVGHICVVLIIFFSVISGSLELDAPPPSSREKENRYTFGSRSSNTHGKQSEKLCHIILMRYLQS